MKFIYEYKTSDNKTHTGVVNAVDRQSAFAKLRRSAIRPSKMSEAPGFFNKLFGRGKRWIAITVLGMTVVLVLVRGRFAPPAYDSGLLNSIDSKTRRQVIGDAAVIDEGIRSGWSSVFSSEGDRFLASFAIPGVPAAVSKSTVGNVSNAMVRVVAPVDGDGIEARQIKAIVAGIKDELREYLSDGGTIAEYAQELVRRQEVEIGYYQRAKREIETARNEKRSQRQIRDLIKQRNDMLRKMGIKLIVEEEQE